MFRQKLVLAVVAGAVSFGGGAAFAATHSASHPAKKPPVRAHSRLQSNVHFPCHNRGAAKITAANV
jgi:hypothetical protein